MKIVSTNLGEPKQVTYKNKTVTTGIFKFPVDKPIFLDTEIVKGDEISDKKYHGGILQAVYGYSLEHYDFWKPKFPALEWSYGMFGENLTITNLDETKIYVGDTFTVGEAIIEATLQRDPCYKLGIRFNTMKIVKQFWNTTMCGVYFKVIQPGFVKTNDELQLIKTNPTKPSIADLYHQQKIRKGT